MWWLILIPIAIYAAKMWWDFNTILPEGYEIKHKGYIDVYYYLYDPEGTQISRSKNTEIYGAEAQYRKMVRVANMHVRSR